MDTSERYDWFRDWQDREARERRDKENARRDEENAIAEERRGRQASEYRRAVAAAVEARGVTPSELVLTFIGVIAEKATEDPPIEVHYLADGTRSAEIVRPSGALAFPDGGLVTTPPITDLAAAATALHELGHLRGEQPADRLAAEAAAWRWARATAPAWPSECQAEMCEALGSHIRAFKGGRERLTAPAMRGLLEAEALVSSLEYARERQRRLQRAIDAERQQLAARLQGRRCDRCRGPASELHEGDVALCRACGEVTRVDAKWAGVLARKEELSK